MDSFAKQKKDIFGKMDKSSIGGIDEKILSLCNLINSREDMFTLSSCSGRVCLLSLAENNNKKLSDWIIATHDLADFVDFLEKFENYDSENLLYFKEESAIIHIRVGSIELGHKLIGLGKECGFNRCSIISANKKIVVEIASSIPISLPIYDGEKLIGDDYLKYLIEASNKKLEQSWMMIEKLEKSIGELK